jgi:hypothetical protein
MQVVNFVPASAAVLEERERERGERERGERERGERERDLATCLGRSLGHEPLCRHCLSCRRVRVGV